MRAAAYTISAGISLLLGMSLLQPACSAEATEADSQDQDVSNHGLGVPLPAFSRSGSVIKFHGNSSRDGFYIDPAMTPANIATMHRDTTFNGAVTGDVYAQPLYVENGPNGNEAFIVATEENHVTALDSAGAVIWDKKFGDPARSGLPCGNIRPLGITGTPVIDEANRIIYFDAMTSDGGSANIRHLIHAISLDTGLEKSGWPLPFSGIVTGADAPHHNQRGALDLVNGVLYIPYGGHYGDCDPYKGTVVGIPVDNPGGAKHWETAGQEGGIWSTGGTTSDGTNIFVATGNTTGASSWAGGEAIIKLKAGPTFSSQPVDFFAPSDWKDLDDGDVDLGGANPVLVDMPGAPVPHLVMAFGKDANLYIGNRDNLGGIGGHLSKTQVASGAILGAGASYKTSQGTYVALRAAYGHGNACPVGGRGNIAVAKITAENPPKAQVVWCTDEKLGSPIATSVDGSSKAVLWDASDKLYAYDGDTGEKIFAGGGASDGLGATMQYFNTPIVAKGRIAVATKGRLVVFKP
jgi:hypothetical protein